MSLIDDITRRDDTATTTANEVDTDKLSLDELRALALKEAGGDAADGTQTRDDKGRFKGADKGAEQADSGEVETEEDDDDAPIVYRREIDLGEGAGKEVFEADTIEELLDKIADAKAHASRKIREQQAELKELKAKPAQQTTQDDKDDDFVLSQEILRTPTEAVKKAFKKATGLDISEFRTIADRVKALDEAQASQADLAAQQQAAQAFLAAHPEYIPSEANGKRLSREMDALIAEAKRQNQKIDYGTLLTKAFEDLSESGLLMLKSEDADNSNAAQTQGTKAERIAHTGDEGQVQRVKRSSSLVTRARATAAPTKTTLTEDDLYKMPLDKLRQLANQR